MTLTLFKFLAIFLLYLTKYPISIWVTFEIILFNSNIFLEVILIIVLIILEISKRYHSKNCLTIFSFIFSLISLIYIFLILTLYFIVFVLPIDEILDNLFKYDYFRITFQYTTIFKIEFFENYSKLYIDQLPLYPKTKEIISQIIHGSEIPDLLNNPNVNIMYLKHYIAFKIQYSVAINNKIESIMQYYDNILAFLDIENDNFFIKMIKHPIFGIIMIMFYPIKYMLKPLLYFDVYYTFKNCKFITWDMSEIEFQELCTREVESLVRNYSSYEILKEIIKWIWRYFR